MEKLVLKHTPSVVMQEKQQVKDDKVLIAVPVSGLIDAKEGKKTHVVASGMQQVVRSDGRIITIQVNAWYK